MVVQQALKSQLPEHADKIFCPHMEIFIEAKLEEAALKEAVGNRIQCIVSTRAKGSQAKARRSVRVYLLVLGGCIFRQHTACLCTK
jgi:hypothetical protein